MLTFPAYPIEPVHSLYAPKVSANQWGGYVIETNEGPLYIGMTNDHDRRFHQHASAHNGAQFIQRFNGPRRVLELFFCETEEQADAWEQATCKAMAAQFPKRRIYSMGSGKGQSWLSHFWNPRPCSCNE